jgi:hypothetical protein
VSYSVVRVVDSGVVLFEEHARRMERAGVDALAAYQRFAAQAKPGVYSLSWGAGRLDVKVRTTVSLFEGMPARFVVSPVAYSTETLPKAPPPNAYSAVRREGVATLLTSADGTEILESCTAAVFSWDGESILLPPDDRPRLLSTAAAAIEARTSCRRLPLRVDATAPLGLVNAVCGPVAPNVAGRDPLPSEARRVVEAALTHSTRRR